MENQNFEILAKGLLTIAGLLVSAFVITEVKDKPEILDKIKDLDPNKFIGND